MPAFLKNRRLRHNILWMNLNNLFGAMRFFSPVSIIYFAQMTGNYTTAMGVYSVASLSQILFEVPLGIISDRWGRRALVVTGCIAELIALTLYVLAVHPPIGSAWMWLYIGATFFGFAEASFSGNNYALLYETLAHYKRKDLIAKVMGRNNSMGQIGLATSGITAALLLFAGASFETLLVLCFIPFGLSILTALLTIEPPRHYIQETNIWAHTKEAIRLINKDKKLRLLTYAEILKGGVNNTTYFFIPQLIALVWPAWLVPLYRMGQNGLGAISFWKAGNIINKWGAAKTLLFCDMASTVISFFAYAFTTIMSPLLLILTQASYAVGMTAGDTLKQQNFTDEKRSTLASLISLAGSLTGAFVALLIGLVADTFSPPAALILILALGSPTIWIYSRLYSHHKTN